MFAAMSLRSSRAMVPAIGLCALSSSMLAAASGAAPRTGTAAAPPARIVGTPVLVTVSGQVGFDRPTADVFFRLSKHLHEPRLIVAQVKGKSGRTYPVRATTAQHCYKSALLLQGGSGGRLRAGSSYRVTFIGRGSAHERTTGKAPFATFTVQAQSRPLVRGFFVSPGCPR
jgi:hypothetical protein